MQEFLEKYPYIRTYLVPIGIGIIGLILIIAGLITSLAPHQEEKISFQNSQEVKGVETTATATHSKQIVVDVSGAVMKQGIYNLNIDSRVQDALEVAGGLAENADREFVDKRINLAAKLVDGGKIYIPKRGETNISASADQGAAGVVDQTAAINVNEASADQLDSLPGIGQVTAQKIISGRPYSQIQDLLTKKVVSNSVFGKIKDKISVN